MSEEEEEEEEGKNANTIGVEISPSTIFKSWGRVKREEEEAEKSCLCSRQPSILLARLWWYGICRTQKSAQKKDVKFHAE